MCADLEHNISREELDNRVPVTDRPDHILFEESERRLEEGSTARAQLHLTRVAQMDDLSIGPMERHLVGEPDRTFMGSSVSRCRRYLLVHVNFFSPTLE